MRKHNGMRPQDIVVLLKIITNPDKDWQNKDLAAELFISPSEISDSLNRSVIASLINTEKNKVHRLSLMEFIEHGLSYVFPVIPGSLVNGMPTAHAHPFMQNHFQSEIPYVWPHFSGNIRGISVEPLYPQAVKAAQQDEILYKMLALIDVIRVGRSREIKVALEALKSMLLYEKSQL